MSRRRRRRDLRQWSGPLFAGLALLLLANAAVYAFVVRPKVRSVWELETNSGPRVQALEEEREAVERLEAYVAGLGEARDDMETLRRDVLATRERRLVDVQAEIGKLCVQFGIPLDKVNYSHEILEAERLDRIYMLVPLEGNYADLRRFLQAVEASDKFLVVERVALGPASSGKAELQLNIVLATYFNAPEELLETLRDMRARARGA